MIGRVEGEEKRWMNILGNAAPSFFRHTAPEAVKVNKAPRLIPYPFVIHALVCIGEPLDKSGQSALARPQWQAVE